MREPNVKKMGAPNAYRVNQRWGRVRNLSILCTEGQVLGANRSSPWVAFWIRFGDSHGTEIESRSSSSEISCKLARGGERYAANTVQGRED